MASFDDLTDLPNRQFFWKHLERIIILGCLQKLKSAFLSMELDGLKHINQSLGYDVEDLALQATGEGLQNNLKVSALS